MNSPGFFHLPRIPIIPAFEPFLPLGLRQEPSAPLSIFAWCVGAFVSPLDQFASLYWPHCDLMASPASGATVAEHFHVDKRGLEQDSTPQGMGSGF